MFWENGENIDVTLQKNFTHYNFDSFKWFLAVPWTECKK